MNLTALSIRRPVFAVMAIGALVVLGLISWGRIGVDMFPKVDFPYVVISTTLEGASPDTVETEITEVIEEAVNTVSGIQSLQSTSTEGLSRVMVEFKLSENADVKAQDVRDRVATVIRDLPTDADPPVVQKVDPDADPILSLMIAGDQDIAAITTYADRIVKPRIERIPGVGSVTLVGGREREIRIWLDAVRLRAYEVTAEDVIAAIRREHAEIPGGRLEQSGGGFEFSVKTAGEVTRVEDFAKLVVAYRPNGTPTRLGDVATVEDGLKDERTYAELNGKAGVSLDIRRQSGQNTLQVAKAVKAEIARMQASLPPGIAMSVAKDISIFIEDSANDVFHDIYVAIGLVTLITFAFLLNIRATGIVSLAIPTSLISTFFLFYVADFTINMQTLMALSLAVGLVVDDAIVVLEAIYRKIEEGMPPAEAAVKGTEEVGEAVLAGTLSVVAVFVPIAFMEGMVGKFLYEYGLAIAFSVMVSLLVSLTLTPLMCARFLHHEDRRSRLTQAIEKQHLRLEAFYSRVIRWAVGHAKTVSLIAAVTLFAGFGIAMTIPGDFFSKADRSEFLGSVDLPYGTGIEAAKDAGRRAAAAIRKLDHVTDVFFTIGASGDQRINQVALYVALTRKNQRTPDQFEIMEVARKAVVAVVPEATYVAMYMVPWVQGGGFQRDISYVIEGPNLDVLREKGDAIVAQMRASPLFADSRTSFEAGKPEARFIIDRDRAGDLSVPIRSLATTIRAMVGGVEAGSFQSDGERFDVRVRLQEDQRDDISKLSLIQVRAADGVVVDVPNVAEITIAEGPAQIDRRNRSRSIMVSANLPAGRPLGPSSAALERIIKDTGLPEGYRLVAAGQSERAAEAVAALGFAFLLAILALYMVLASEFNSFSQPLIMMLAAPLSFFGAFLTLKISGLPLSMFANIGLIALMGLVLKNGILLVDYANTKRSTDTSPRDAMIEAGITRLRPVLMTALAMSAGMLPAVFADSQGAEMRAPMAVLIVGGILSSTVLTLVVVPSIYVMSMGAGGWWTRLLRAGLGRLTGRRGTQPAE